MNNRLSAEEIKQIKEEFDCGNNEAKQIGRRRIIRRNVENCETVDDLKKQVLTMLNLMGKN